MAGLHFFLKGLHMKKQMQLLLAFTGMLTASTAFAANQAAATLTFFDQRGLIENSASSTANITSVIYSLGTADAGIATWDTGAAGGVASDFLSDSRYFQTVTWNGLNIAAGDTFNFGTLDIDLITSLSPLSVTGSVLDEVGTSLANATLSLLWSDGGSTTVSLVEQAWRDTQYLSFATQTSAVPVPAALFMFAPALLGLMGYRRKLAK